MKLLKKWLINYKQHIFVQMSIFIIKIKMMITIYTLLIMEK